MGVGILICLLFLTSVVAISKPQVGAYAYIIMSIMAPQYIWPWIFEGIPAFTIVAISTIGAFALSLILGKLDLSIYKHKQNILLLIIWGMFHLSEIFSPFTSFYSAVGATLVLETLNTIMIMYFITLPLLSKPEHLKIICFLFMGIFIYYVYWSNDAYFNFDITRFGFNNRLLGPWKSPYRDENVFATLFVVGMPFLLFGLFLFKSTLLRAVLGMALLFSLHSIILTGSRGALVGVSAIVLFAYFLIKVRTYRILLVVGFILAIVYQGGQMLERTTDTINTAQQGEEEPIDPRIVSWTIGLELIKTYPILGAGVQRFQEASKVHFPQHKSQVAHNTFLCFAANTGLLTGLIYLYFYFLHFKNFRFAIKHKVSEDPLFDYFNNVFMTSLTGLYVCSIFLDLIIYESFYFLLLLNLLKDKLFRQKLISSQTAENPSFQEEHLLPKNKYQNV